MSLSHFLGFDGGSWYDFWSGAAQGLMSLGFIGAFIGLYRKHNCHVKGCPRIGKQKIDGTEWVVCHKHHPSGVATPEKIAAHVARQQGMSVGQPSD